MKKLYTFLVLAFAVLSVNAQPANDDCSNAATLTVGNICVPVAGTTAGSTASFPSTTCWGSSTFDVWYKFVAVSGMNIIELQCSPNFYGVQELMANCSGPTLGCKGSGPGLTDTIMRSLIPGNTYYIRVYDYWAPSPSQTFNICVYTALTGIASTSNIAQITISPNPSSGIFTLQSDEEITSVEIYNILGEHVFSSAINDQQLTIDLFTQSKGIYFVKVVCRGKVITQKIVLE